MKNTTREFRAWLHRNSPHLEDYAPNEIARLAISCGFPLDVVCGPSGDHFFFLKRLIHFWNSPFRTKWVRVQMYDHGHGDLDL